MEELIQDLYEIHTDHDKLLKSGVYADGNCDDFDHGTVQGWKEAMELVITRLEKLIKQEHSRSKWEVK
tara:strand:- start:426 stop:629 length:204 start_codon:yes stop_codon:yes gene_type:complete